MLRKKLLRLEEIVPYKCCHPSLNISEKKDSDTDFFFPVLSITFIEHGQNVNKHTIIVECHFFEQSFRFCYSHLFDR